MITDKLDEMSRKEVLQSGNELIKPMAVGSGDFRAFRFFLYGSNVAPAPYVMNSIEANQWTNSNVWNEFRTVFQFSDSFWDKNPASLHGWNMYYSARGSSCVKTGILYHFTNPQGLTMTQVYNTYNFSSILLDCLPVLIIPGGQEYFDLDLSLLPDKNGIYVLGLSQVYNDSNTYASTAIMCWDTNYPCMIVPKHELILKGEEGWLRKN